MASRWCRTASSMRWIRCCGLGLHPDQRLAGVAFRHQGQGQRQHQCRRRSRGGRGVVYAVNGLGDCGGAGRGQGTQTWRINIVVPARSPPTVSNGRLFVTRSRTGCWRWPPPTAFCGPIRRPCGDAGAGPAARPWRRGWWSPVSDQGAGSGARDSGTCVDGWTGRRPGWQQPGDRRFPVDPGRRCWTRTRVCGRHGGLPFMDLPTGRRCGNPGHR